MGSDVDAFENPFDVATVADSKHERHLRTKMSTNCTTSFDCGIASTAILEDEAEAEEALSTSAALA